MGSAYEHLKSIHESPGAMVLQGNTGHGGVPEPSQVPLIPPNTNMGGVKIGDGGNPSKPANCVPSLDHEPRGKGQNPKDY